MPRAGLSVSKAEPHSPPPAPGGREGRAPEVGALASQKFKHKTVSFTRDLTV